ncbi:hypothetical protein [Terrimonas alba]|uniref:hypothetical protein n=1 Tax=Terrimonas alba TaxID=3349636 RepID=UPI0035F2A6F2
MQQVKNSICFFVMISVLLLMSCNGPDTKSESTAQDTTAITATNDTVPASDYDPNLDIYNTGGNAIQKLHDSLGIKLYVATMKSGDSAALHSHPDHAVYLLQGGKLAVTFQGKGRQEMNLPTGAGFISGPVVDAGKNIGNTTVKMLVADIYRPRGSGASSMPGYDPALDPLTVGASFSKKLHDTLNIKFFEAALKPGQSAALHAHPDHVIYVLQGGKLAFYPTGEGRKEAELKAGEGWVGGPLTDSAKNIGKTTIRVLEIDVYRPRGK